jgi:hypothetical protein
MKKTVKIIPTTGAASQAPSEGDGTYEPVSGTAIELKPVTKDSLDRKHTVASSPPDDGGPSVTIHDAGLPGVNGKRFSRSNPLIYEAIPLLKEHGFLPVRITESSLPLNLLGLRKTRSILVRLIRSRNPVPSAAVLHALFKEEVEYLCRLASAIPYQIMIWVYSLACGWRYYLVYPGGLRRDLDFPASLNT